MTIKLQLVYNAAARLLIGVPLWVPWRHQILLPHICNIMAKRGRSNIVLLDHSWNDPAFISLSHDEIMTCRVLIATSNKVD